MQTAKRYVTARAIHMWSEAKVGWDGLVVLLPGVGIPNVDVASKADDRPQRSST